MCRVCSALHNWILNCSAETWIAYRPHIHTLDRCHLKCIRKILDLDDLRLGEVENIGGATLLASRDKAHLSTSKKHHLQLLRSP